ncbi:MAG: bifunctional oligoribonuclease/PAP phosphatase NrnA [Eubacterium sp.]|nr:bifunctional oligoribonuclease/PAP phosphatase NrnA [Eubacterium sp.]
MLIDVKRAARMLKQYDDYLILSHANPDGDTLGCAYALCGILQKMGKRAKCLCADEVADRMKYLAEAIEVQEFEHKTIVSVDVADRKLLGALDKVYGDEVFLAIDHHGSRTEFAEFTLVEPDSAAACELIYEIAEELDVPLNDKIAACLYTGLSTDTGCFRFSNTTPRTHQIAAKLMEYHFPYAGLNYMLFDMKSKGRISLEQDVYDSMEFYADDKIALVCLTLELMDRHSGSVDAEDFNGIAGLPRRIEGVELGVTVKQKEEKVFKISVRSSEKIDAAKLCEKFNGGGHARAAGCTLEGTLDEVKAMLLPVLMNAIDNCD